MPENEVDKFLEGLNDEPKDDPFKPEVAEDPFAQPAKEEEKEEEAKEEKPLPFHKDPKVQRFIDKAVEKRLAESKPTETERFVKETTEDDPLADVLTRLIGNDTPEKVSTIKDFKKALEGRDEKVKQATLKEIQAQGEEEKRAEAKAQAELSEGFENIEEEFGVDLTSNTPIAKKARNEFVDFIKLIAPKDSDGQVREFPDLPESFKLFQGMKKQSVQPSRAKELASRSMTHSSGVSNDKKPTDQSWNGVNKLFGF